MGQIAALAFFTAVLVGAAAILFLTVKDHLSEILAALRGELPTRAAARPWMRSVRASARPRPAQQARVVQPQRRAAV